jgi:hypothetical protein
MFSGRLALALAAAPQVCKRELRPTPVEIVGAR